MGALPGHFVERIVDCSTVLLGNTKSGNSPDCKIAFDLDQGPRARQAYLGRARPACKQGGPRMDASDPAFWRAGAISSTLVMLVVLAFLTVDSLATIKPGNANVPHYTVINK